MSSRHRLTAGRHLSAGQLVRISQDLNIGFNPCPNGSCNENECDHPDSDCCEPLGGEVMESYGATHDPAQRNFYKAEDLFAQENGGATFAGMLGFGAINLLVPSHSQIFADNRSKLNNAADNAHSAVYNISTNLGFARYRKDYNAHDKMKSVSYSTLKQSMPLTPRMSMGEDSGIVNSAKGTGFAGGIQVQKLRNEKLPDPPKARTNITQINDPRELSKFRFVKRSLLEDQNINPDGLVLNSNYATIPYSDIKTHILTEIGIASGIYRRGGFTSKVNIGREFPVLNENTIVDPSSILYTDGKVFYLSEDITEESSFTTVEKITTTKTGKKETITVFETKTTTTSRETTSTKTIGEDSNLVKTTSDRGDDTIDTGTPAQPLTDDDDDIGNCSSDICASCSSACAIGCDNCDDCICTNCELCPETCEPPSECLCNGQLCGYVCGEQQCPSCGECGGCFPDLPSTCPGFCGEECDLDNCPTNEGCGCGEGPPQDCPECGGSYCPGGEDICFPLSNCSNCCGSCNPENGQCCNPVHGNGGCVGSNPACIPCDPCPNSTTLELNGSGEITSVKGNFTNRDLVPIGYFSHDLDFGDLGAANSDNVISQNDVILSCTLTLTVSEIYGRLPFVGAKPYVKPLKLDVYEVLQGIDPNSVSCSQYSTGKNWTSASGRNGTDRAADPFDTITLGESTKPGDKITINLTSLARKKQQAGGGALNFMIEPSQWFSGSTGDTVASDATEKVAMLVQFHRTGQKRPKVSVNLMRNRSVATNRLAPGVARRRLAAGTL